MAQVKPPLSSQICSGSKFPQKFDRADYAMYLRVIRRHPAMKWANGYSLGEDFEQLGLLEVFKVLESFNSSVGTSPVQYVSVVMRRRLYDCFRTLTSTYSDKTASVTCSPKGQSNVATESAPALADQFTGIDILCDRTSLTDHDSHSFGFAYSPVVANDASDRFTSCDEGESYPNELQHDELIDSVLQGVEATDQARLFLFFMDKLPVRQREIVDLTLADYTDQEIATALQVTPQAVHKTKQKAVATMRTFLLGYMQ